MFKELWQVCGQSCDDEERGLGGREPLDYAGVLTTSSRLCMPSGSNTNCAWESGGGRCKREEAAAPIQGRGPQGAGSGRVPGRLLCTPGLFTFLDGVGYMDVCFTDALQMAITGIMPLYEGCFIIINQENKK